MEFEICKSWWFMCKKYDIVLYIIYNCKKWDKGWLEMRAVHVQFAYDS